MRARSLAGLIASFLLAACHSAPNDNGSANGVAGNSDADSAMTGMSTLNTADLTSDDPSRGSAPAPSPAANAIPSAFHGRWGMVPGDCGPDASIAKGLMVVDGAMLRFYESVGKPAVVTNPTPSRMEGRFSFTGEGQDWSKDMTLEIKGDGNTLVRSEKDPSAIYSYKRCPA